MAEREDKKNIYKQDEKNYVRKISKCSCVEKRDNFYYLTCRIKERGEKDYFCGDNPEFIQRDSKKLWLSDEARIQIEGVIAEFKKNAEGLCDDSCTKIEVESCQTVIHIRKLGKDRYDILLEIGNPYTPSGCSDLLLLYMDSTVSTLLSALSWHLSGDEKTLELIRHSTRETISENPVYRSAINNEDIDMERLIKLYYRIADEDECRWLSDNVFETYILPPLSDEYNREFCVESAGINTDLLTRSGYRILHKPFFAMPGYTHTVWTLNPHKKVGVDAALEKGEKITFDHYLSFFDKTQEGDNK